MLPPPTSAATASVTPPDAPAPAAAQAARIAAAPHDDRALMQGIAQRDPAALASLYDRHAGLVYSLCHQILRDPSAAEEVLLDVFWEVWNKWERFDLSRGSATTYLAVLARSRALDRLRATRSPRRIENVHENSGAAAADQAAPGAAAPLERALEHERRQHVRAALAALEPDPRRAIELAYFEGLSQSEIADRMRKPLGTVKTWVRQGLIRLRDHLRTDM